MNAPLPSVDFDEIRKNAEDQQIPLTEIAIFYKDLTEDQIASMRHEDLIKSSTDSVVIGKFRTDGTVIFPEKATAAYYLAAD